MQRLIRAFIILAPAFFLATAGGTASAADAATEARAKALYAEAIAALEAKDYERACPKLQSVIALVPDAVGARITLGECLERQGRLASAYRAYSEAAELAARLGQTVRHDKAEASAKALSLRCAALKISTPAGTQALPGLVVRLDGALVAADSLGKSVFVDRGEHVITAVATGRTAIERKVRVDADGATIAVALEGLEPVQATATSPPSTAPVEPRAWQAKSPIVEPRAWQVKSPIVEPLVPLARPGLAPPGSADSAAPDRGKVAAIVLVAVGGATLAAGLGAGMVAIDKRDASNSGHCTGNKCDASGVDLRRGSLQAGGIATGLIVAGGALAGSGVVIALWPAKTKTRVGVVVGPAGIGLRGDW